MMPEAEKVSAWFAMTDPETSDFEMNLCEVMNYVYLDFSCKYVSICSLLFDLQFTTTRVLLETKLVKFFPEESVIRM